MGWRGESRPPYIVAPWVLTQLTKQIHERINAKGLPLFIVTEMDIYDSILAIIDMVVWMPEDAVKRYLTGETDPEILDIRIRPMRK